MKSTPKRRRMFLESLAENGNVSVSARTAGIHRVTAYKWRRADPEFAAGWEEAIDISVDLLLEEARRRAHDGVDEPVFYQGEQCGAVRRYSDSLLMFLIKGKRPEYASERRELTGKDRGPMEISNLSDEEVERRFTEIKSQMRAKILAEMKAANPETTVRPGGPGV
jgi:hypothetical protein